MQMAGLCWMQADARRYGGKIGSPERRVTSNGDPAATVAISVRVPATFRASRRSWRPVSELASGQEKGTCTRMVAGRVRNAYRAIDGIVRRNVLGALSGMWS